VGIYLRAMRNGEFVEKRLNVDVWDMLTKLAETGGWQPAGTQDPSYWGDPEWSFSINPQWNGNYYTNDYQIITDDDARSLAAGLRIALDDIPDLSGPPIWAELSPDRDPSAQAIIQALGGGTVCGVNTELSPLQFFSGEAGRGFVVRMADFFAGGECQIALSSSKV